MHNKFLSFQTKKNRKFIAETYSNKKFDPIRHYFRNVHSSRIRFISGPGWKQGDLWNFWIFHYIGVMRLSYEKWHNNISGILKAATSKIYAGFELRNDGCRFNIPLPIFSWFIQCCFEISGFYPFEGGRGAFAIFMRSFCVDCLWNGCMVSFVWWSDWCCANFDADDVSENFKSIESLIS